MKRVFRFSLLLSLMTASMFFLAPTSQAEAGTWTWKRYRLKFWLPKGVRATTNNRRTFIAKGKGLVLKIHAWKSRRGTSVRAAKYGFRSYRIIKRKRILIRKRLRGKYSYRGGKTWRYMYVGDGYVGRKRVYWAVIGMANHRLRTHYYVRMWWPKWRHRWVKNRVKVIARSIRNY